MKRFFFGGKGGVGKTTVSSAFALLLARHYNTRLISIDPAHSLTDVFDIQIGNKETSIPLHDQFRGQLHAIELDPRQALERYKSDISTKVRRLGLHFDFDIQQYIDTVATTPGANDAAIFDQFTDQLSRTDVDAIVFDTAPTGSTLQLLQMSGMINRWMKMIVRSRLSLLKLRRMYQEPTDDAVLAELSQMKQRFKSVRKLLTRKDTHFILIVTPDKLSFDETKRAIASLRKTKLAVRGLLINRVLSEHDHGFEGLLPTQQVHLKRIHEQWGSNILGELPWLTTLPHGVAELTELATALESTQLTTLT